MKRGVTHEGTRKEGTKTQLSISRLLKPDRETCIRGLVDIESPGLGTVFADHLGMGVAGLCLSLVQVISGVVFPGLWPCP